MNPPSSGPSAKPTGPLTPKTAMSAPSRRIGTTSRIAASMTPVLPSWNPTNSMLSASCHGSRLRATPANTAASTRALRATTAFRLYLSAQTPQSGTSGAPTMKISDPKIPTKRSRSGSATPISRR